MRTAHTARYGEQSTAKVISAWARKSSSGTTTYEIQLHEDGVLSCNCPAWVLRKTRDCKHVKELVYVAGEIMSGRRNPIWEQEEHVSSFTPPPLSRKASQKMGVGRLIERVEEE